MAKGQRGAQGHVGGAAHDELPHDDAKGVDVARLVQAAAVVDLGRDVEGCAATHVARVALAVLDAPGEPKVGYLGRGRTRQQRVTQAAVLPHVVLHTTTATSARSCCGRSARSRAS